MSYKPRRRRQERIFSMDHHGILGGFNHLYFSTKEMKLAARALLDGSENHIHIFGPRRHGKTSTCQYVSQQFEKRQGVAYTLDLREQYRSKDVDFFGAAVHSSSLSCLRQFNKADDFYHKISALSSMQEKGRFLFEELTRLFSKSSNPVCLVLEEVDPVFLHNKENGSVLLEFLKCQKEVGKRAGFSLITTSLPPLSWLASYSEEDKAFSNDVAHVRIKKLPRNFIRELEKAVPYGNQQHRLKVAEEIWAYAGGYPGLIYEIVSVMQRGNEVSTFEQTIEEIKQSALKNWIGQITPSQENFILVPRQDFEVAQNAYATLSDAPSGSTIQTDPLSALHLALSGFAECADDGVTIGPIVPFFKEAAAIDKAPFPRFSPHKSTSNLTGVEFCASTTGFRQLRP